MSTTFEWGRDSIRSAAWAPVAVFLTHLVISRGLGWYQTVPELDIPMHFLGGVAIAYFFSRSIGLESAVQVLGTMTALGRFVLSLALVSTATVVWEFTEWTTDHLRLTNAQGGLNDTMLDMLLGILGGAAFLLVSIRLTTDPEATSDQWPTQTAPHDKP